MYEENVRADLTKRQDSDMEWVCPQCHYRNDGTNKVCMGAEMGDGRCGEPKPE